MPTYEFACPNGHEFEKFYKMSEAPAESPCPTCGEAGVRRISGGAGLVFKGSGFYLTDYGKNAHRKSGDAPKKEGGEAGGAKSGGESAAGGASGGKGADGAKSSESKPAQSKPAESKQSAPKKGE